MSFHAIKIETEAEGASWEQIRAIQRIAKSSGLPVFLKIGGVEARTDIRAAQDLAIEGVIAPMVESVFAVEKFHEATAGRGFSWRALTIESITAFRDLEAIVQEAKAMGINGATFGRGDFSASIGAKGGEETEEVNSYAKYFVEVVTEYGLIPSIGGNVQATSIKNLSASGLRPKFLETRRVVFDWSPDSEASLALRDFKEAITWEKEAIQQFNQLLNQELAININRIQLLEQRRGD